MNTAVLIVEDDEDLGQLLKQYLELNGFSVVWCVNGQEARAQLEQQLFDIVLTDVMMPVEDGFTFAAGVSLKYPQIPLLFITARKLQEDKIRGLTLGADDYIVKPFDAEELVLRIKNILKRAAIKKKVVTSWHIGHYIFYPDELLLEGPHGRQLLTERESAVLLLLREHSGQLVRKRTILNLLWKESDFFSGRSLDVFVSRLRKYLAGDQRIIIESVRGTGLRLMITD